MPGRTWVPVALALNVPVTVLVTGGSSAPPVMFLTVMLPFTTPPPGTDAKDYVFTIPTPAGSIKLEGLSSFVTVKAGGYFFMPSRSALRYLARNA